MAGACVAYHLLKNNAEPPSIGIFEARQACSGATGRNGGHSKFSPISILRMYKNSGVETAEQYTAFHAKVRQGLKECIESEGIDCDFYLTRSFDVLLDAEQAAGVKADVQRLREADVPWLADIQYLEGPHLERLTGVVGAQGATTTSVCSLWPYKFVLGLLQKCIDMGANLQTHTPVTSISRNSADGFSILQTPRGATRARKVIFATNAYVGNLLSQYWNVIVPGKGTACHITSDAKNGMPVLTNTYNMHQNVGNREYMVPQPDGGVVLGGGQYLYRHQKDLWFDNVDDSSQIILEDGSDVQQRFFDPYMSKHFVHCHSDRRVPGTTPTADMLWTGIMGYTKDGAPHIGQVPGEKDWYLLAGFNGGGMALIYEAARGIAAMVKDCKAIEETGIPEAMWASEKRLDCTFDLASSPPHVV